jgi:hypothetical protein
VFYQGLINDWRKACDARMGINATKKKRNKQRYP